MHDFILIVSVSVILLEICFLRGALEGAVERGDRGAWGRWAGIGREWRGSSDQARAFSIVSMPLQHGDAEDASSHALRLGLELDGDLFLPFAHLFWNVVVHVEELAGRVAIDRLRGKLLVVD